MEGLSVTIQKSVRLILLAGLVLGLTAGRADAQFGRNKVQYDKFDFKVLATQHFDIYYYPSEAAAVNEAGRMAERWYGRLSRLFGHELSSKQTVILYASHPDFEQTNIIEGELDEGTGGVTESARRRVVLPMAATLADSDHVLGHELVHAFQYDILERNVEGLPLWFIEGMAEYLSLGPVDAQTAMWLRDAAIQDRLPKLTDLDNPRYFPYRFGHAIWAYVGGKLGDNAIGQILQGLTSSEGGPGRASNADAVSILEIALGEKRDAISAEWRTSILDTYGITPSPDHAKKLTAAEKRAIAESGGGAIIGEQTGDGGLNVGPALSPDGSRIAFLSARDRLSIDLFVADAATGRIEHRLIRTAGDPHFESLQFLASAGAWSPDGKRLALATVRKGRPALALVDTDSGDIVEEIPFKDLGEIFQPSWSPDGKSIVVSAQTGGLTDLYLCDIAAKTARKLTDDEYADLMPAWSPDGSRIVFVTDRFRGDLAKLSFNGLGLALLDPATGAVTRLDTGLEQGRAISPQWSPDSKTVYFISDVSGRPNIYRLDVGTARAVRVTDIPTGVAGITPTSPALSVASKGSRMAYSVFTDGGYEIRFADPSTLEPTGGVGDPRDTSALPPVQRTSVVAKSLATPTEYLPPAGTTFQEQDAAKKFSLVGVGPSVGVSTGGAFGTYFSGGVSFLFSDILGNHLLATGISMNGEARDFGVSAQYVNRTNRWNWSLFGERAPLVNGTVGQGLTTVNGQTLIVQQTDLFRETYTQTGALAAYPFSRSLRVEFGGAATHIGFSHEVISDYYDPFSGAFLGETKGDVASDPSLNLYDVRTALVRDTAAFGATSPILGQRFRAEIDPTTGDLHMTNLTLDFRQYMMPVRPVTFAIRAVHMARYGASADDQRLLPLYLGYPTLVRGYDINTFTSSECTPTVTGSCTQFDRLIGSRIMVFNAEARVPVVGLFTGRMDYGPVPAELFAFFDSGIAWDRTVSPSFAGGSRDWVKSVGAGARVNAMGFAILEFNLVRPLDRPGRGWMFVFNLRPGF